MLYNLPDFISAFEHKDVIGFISFSVVVLVAAFREYRILWHPRYRVVSPIY